MIAACSSDANDGGSLPTVDGGTGSTKKDSSTGKDDDDTKTDGGKTDTKDASTKDADTDADTDSGGTGDGTECFFNKDCAANLRCDCVNEECTCQPGARGTGRNGVDKCTSGNDCASSVCVEGPEPADDFYCSDECTADNDCGGILPICSPIGICARVP